MAQVPQRQGALVVRQPGDLRHRPAAAGLVVHLGQHHDGDFFGDGGGQVIGRDDAQFGALAQQALQALQDIEVGGEVAGLRQDHLAAGIERQGAGGQLEEVHRGRVGGDHLVRPGPDQPGDLAADAGRCVDPAGGVPALDEVGSPLGLQGLGHPRRRRLGQGAQGIAVEVDDPVRQVEGVAETGQRIGRVQALDIGGGSHLELPQDGAHGRGVEAGQGQG
jgi:hypothetical protein